jgi:hypothetical protein
MKLAADKRSASERVPNKSKTITSPFPLSFVDAVRRFVRNSKEPLLANKYVLSGINGKDSNASAKSLSDGSNHEK